MIVSVDISDLSYDSPIIIVYRNLLEVSQTSVGVVNILESLLWTRSFTDPYFVWDHSLYISLLLVTEIC